jgi:hypothetical protein
MLTNLFHCNAPAAFAAAGRLFAAAGNRSGRF